MKSIDCVYEDLLVINKSKFYAFAYPVTSEEEIRCALDKLRKKYSDATHICYAYSLSNPRLEKADDNGEPSGTAGRPILELIKKRGLENVLIAVVRYFGGIKLGAGGLVRAYTNASNLVVDKASIVEIIEKDKYLAVADVTVGSRLRNYIITSGGEVLAERYDEYYQIEYCGVEKDSILGLFPHVQVKTIGKEKIYVRDN